MAVLVSNNFQLGTAENILRGRFSLRNCPDQIGYVHVCDRFYLVLIDVGGTTLARQTWAFYNS